METLDYPSWRWGLSLIALTMAIHAAAVVMMGMGAVKVRLRLEARVFDLWHLILIMICIVAVIGLLFGSGTRNRVRDLGSGVLEQRDGIVDLGAETGMKRHERGSDRLRSGSKPNSIGATHNHAIGRIRNNIKIF